MIKVHIPKISWEYAVENYINLLLNPNATEKNIKETKKELRKLAKSYDMAIALLESKQVNSSK